METLKEKVQKYSVTAGVAVICGVGKIGLLLPYTRKQIYRKMLKVSYASSDDDFKDTLFRKKMRKSLVKHITIDTQKTVSLKKSIPDLPVLRLSVSKLEVTNTTLKSLQKPGRPLVINFGSCSWPPFLATLTEYFDLADKYQNKVDFVILYIEEAHPSGDWNLKVREHFFNVTL